MSRISFLIFAGLLQLAVIGNTYSQSGCEGYYKDLFMDGGVELTSRTILPAADYLELTMEFIATENPGLQSSLLISNINDENGILLYPDGEPRFRIIYTNGGLAKKHGLSLTEAGRNNIRMFFNNGGTYSGSCAGAFIASISPDTNAIREEYYHIWPGYTLSTGQSNIYTGHNITTNSPLLNYYSYGGDKYVDNVRHNGGGFAYEPNMPPGTEILARYDYPASAKMNNKASVWAYKNPDRLSEGRLVITGSHPESITSGERRDLMAAILQYALDGQGKPDLKSSLINGETRVMDKSTYENDPDYTKIGDKQYHHFIVDLSGERNKLEVNISGDDNYDLSLYVNLNDFAFNSNAIYKDRTKGANKKMILNDLEAGTYYISVECETSVTALRRNEYFEYTKNLDILNGVPYTIKADWSVVNSIKRLDIENFEVYPNPFAGCIKLKIPNNNLIGEVSIIDYTGNLVYKKEIRNPVSELTIEAVEMLSPGTYYLRLRSADRVYLKRIVKVSM